jgi:hypothetical protein
MHILFYITFLQNMAHLTKNFAAHMLRTNKINTKCWLRNGPERWTKNLRRDSGRRDDSAGVERAVAHDIAADPWA